MSIVRIINGKNNQLHRMKTMVDYLNDSTKQVWQDEELSEIDLVRSYGVTFENAFLVFKSMHYSYGYPGTRLYYHILISFDDEKVEAKRCPICSRYSLYSDASLSYYFKCYFTIDG